MKRAGELLDSFINEYMDGNLMEKARGYSKFFSAWSSILTGEQIPAAADHSRVVELERHIVYVEADHPGWIQILQTKQAEILAVLRRRFPEFELRGIAFRYAAAPFNQPRSSPQTPPPPGDEKYPLPPPPDPIPGPSLEAINRIEDPELVNTLKQMRKNIIARERLRNNG